MAPSISDQIRMEYAVTGSGLAGGRYNVRKFVRDVGKLTELQKNVGTKAQRRAVGQAAADRATAAIGGGVSLAGRGRKKTKLQAAMCT